jgi:hypothetical protein
MEHYRMSENQNSQQDFKDETSRKNTMSKFDEFKKQSKKARFQAATYLDLQEGDSAIIEVLIDKGATTEEFEGTKGKYSKVKYTVLDMDTGKALDWYLTAKQSSKADEEIEKLILRNLKPLLRIKKIDQKTLDIEGILQQQ